MIWKHDSRVSMAKGVGIILMVAGHSGIPLVMDHFIYAFHMPLFFFISGYLFKEYYLHDKKRFIIRKVKSLYIPFVKWSLIFLALHNLFTYCGFYGSFYTAKDFLNKAIHILSLTGSEQLLGGYWYLIDAFISSIIVIFILYGIDRLTHRVNFTPIKVYNIAFGGGVIY